MLVNFITKFIISKKRNLNFKDELLMIYSFASYKGFNKVDNTKYYHEITKPTNRSFIKKKDKEYY